MGKVARVLRDNGLTIALVSVFVLCLTGMTSTGWIEHNAELVSHGAAEESLWAYFTGADFQSALFENWESEFLQMASYVIMTAVLFQRGSAESKDPDGANAEDAAADSNSQDAPWPVRVGGIWSALYSYSLGLALILLFVVSFFLHWAASAYAASAEARLHGEAVPSMLAYLAEPRFWFESFQNWQSEFLSTAVLVVLSIVLRHRGSPESKAVADPHRKTGH